MDFPARIVIGSDHAGYELKEIVKKFIQELGIELNDYGTDSPDSVDYPDFAHAVARAIEDEPFPFGILICGTANGIAMSANKHAHIRAAIAWSEEIAILSRTHNDANVICLPARFIEEDVALKSIAKFLTTEFEGGRHARRVEKIASC